MAGGLFNVGICRVKKIGSLCFAEEVAADVVVESFSVQVANGQIGRFFVWGHLWWSHNDAILVHLLYLLQVDDIGPVYAHEACGQLFLQFLHGE